MKREKTPIGIILFVIIFFVLFFFVQSRNDKKERINQVSVSYEGTPESTAFSEIGYDEDQKVLAVIFRESGDKYYYWDVPYAEWKEFSEAESLGGYYNTYIKENYKYDKVK